MEFRVLKYFLTVARVGSITGAANYLHLTQPTLSRQLQDLEIELGQKLFIRGQRTISLTSEGMILRKRAEAIIDMVEKTQNEFLSLKNDISGEVHIGSGETETIKLIGDIINDIRSIHSEIIFHLYSGIMEDVLEKIDNGTLDFGIVMQPVDLVKYNAINLPGKNIWGVLMKKDAPLAKKDFVTYKDMESLPLILSRKVYRKPIPDNEFYRWFHKNQSKLDIVATHTLFYNAALMVKQGAGYMFTLNNLANTSQSSNLCFRPIEPAFYCSWAFVWKKYQIFSPASKLFLDKMQEKFGESKLL